MFNGKGGLEEALCSLGIEEEADAVDRRAKAFTMVGSPSDDGHQSLEGGKSGFAMRKLAKKYIC